MSASDLSSLSSAESIETDEEIRNAKARKGPIESYFKPKSEAAPAKKKRAPSPPHEYVLADNPDIAVSKFTFFTFACRLHKLLHHVSIAADAEFTMLSSL